MKYRFNDMFTVNYQVNDLVERVEEEKKALEDFEEILLKVNNLLALDQTRKEVIRALSVIESEFGLA